MRVEAWEAESDWTVQGEGGPLFRTYFMADSEEKTYVIGAVAWCRVGDFIELNERDRAARARGRTLPGDRGVTFGE